MYGCGVKDIEIHYRAGRENQSADALSRSPYLLPPAVGIAEGEVQVASVTSQDPTQGDPKVDGGTTEEAISESSNFTVTSGKAVHHRRTFGHPLQDTTGRQEFMPSEAGHSNSITTTELEVACVQPTGSLDTIVGDRGPQEQLPQATDRDGEVTPERKAVSGNIPRTGPLGLEAPDWSPPNADSAPGPQTEATTVDSTAHVLQLQLEDTPGMGTVETATTEPEPNVDCEGSIPTTGVMSDNEHAGATGETVGKVRTTSPQSGHPPAAVSTPHDMGKEQLKDPGLKQWIDYLSHGSLPRDEAQAQKIVLQSAQLSMLDGVIYHVNSKTRHRRAVVPTHLRPKILQETHAGRYSGHFCGRWLYDTLMSAWWWPGMYTDAEKFATSCPECVIATGTGRRNKPPLHPIPVQRPFQVLGIDVMDLPVTERGNKHVVVIQDLFTKWPMVFPVPDQKALRIARLIAEEVVPLFGVPECLLSDRGTNLLSHLVLDLCRMLGITKLNTTAHHPQCDGAVERFNRTLKTMLRKHAARFGMQWDSYLSGVLWAYRNTPHTSTGEKPSFLLFGMDCRSPTEAAYMPTSDICSTYLDDYREQLMATLSSARELAASNIQRAQKRYKQQYDHHTRPADLRAGEWVFVRGSHKMSLAGSGSCQDPGTAPTACYTREIRMLLCPRCTIPSMVRFVSTSHVSVSALTISQLGITGMGGSRKAQVDPQSGSSNSSTLDCPPNSRTHSLPDKNLLMDRVMVPAGLKVSVETSSSLSPWWEKTYSWRNPTWRVEIWNPRVVQVSWTPWLMDSHLVLT